MDDQWRPGSPHYHSPTPLLPVSPPPPLPPSHHGSTRPPRGCFPEPFLFAFRVGWRMILVSLAYNLALFVVNNTNLHFVVAVE